MCVIAGIISLAGTLSLADGLGRMVRLQAHRGPDGQGTWSGRVGGADVALGSVRLAILDLSDAGLQPMVSASGRQVLVYNGEIYNYRELRADLESAGVRFGTKCDTEVVLQALATWGESAFAGFNGSGGLAGVALAPAVMLLSRDRSGVNPLYC